MKYVNKLNTLSLIKETKVHLFETIIDGINLFGYVIYSSADIHCQQCVSDENINDMAKWANSSNAGATELEFGLIDGGQIVDTMVMAFV